MTRLLKLTQLQTYIGAHTKTGQGEEASKVEKGQVVAWDDAVADDVLTGVRIDREGNEVPYFEDVTDDYEGKIDHDFTERARKSNKPVRHTNQLPGGDSSHVTKMDPDAETTTDDATDDAAATTSRVAAKTVAAKTVGKVAAKSTQRVSRSK